jgi:hypothetical protein
MLAVGRKTETGGTMDADEWAKLGKDERIAHCRRTAREAEKSADTAGLEMRDIYKRLAAHWHLLAVKIERAENNEPVGESLHGS